jgi:integrase
MPALYKRGKYWYLRYVENGELKWVSLETQSKRAALKEKDRILAGLPQTTDAKPKPKRDLTLEELKAKYSTWAKAHRAPATVESRERAIDSFGAVTGCKTVAEIEPQHIEDFKRLRLAEEKKIGPRTVNEALGALKAAVNRAIRQKWYVGANPFTNVEWVPEPEKRPLWLDKAQIKTVMTAAKKDGANARAIFALGIYAGLRKREIDRCRWEWFDWEQELLHVDPLKGKKHRTIPLHRELAKALKPLRKAEGYVVEPEKELGSYRYRFDIRKTFDRVLKAVKLEWVTPHTLRHTFASQLVTAGVPLFKVTVWLGHSDPRTTMIYAHLAPADKDINRF